MDNHSPYCIEDNSQSIQIHPSEERKRSTQVHSFGSIRISYILCFFVPLDILACLYCYHQAVTKKEQPPYPHATITSTACHYSQDILFRFILLPSGGFIALIYYVAYKWLASLKKRTQYPGDTFGYLLKWGLASVLGFYGAIATIDGKDRPPIHGIGAVFFFVILYVLSTSISIVMWDIRQWDSQALRKISVNIKAAISLYLFGVALYFIAGIISEYGNEDNKGEDIYLVTFEWNLTIGCLIWLVTFALDMPNVHLTLKGNFAQTVKLRQRVAMQ